MSLASVIPGSFRDPSGFLFERDGILYRQINEFYRENYEHLMQSGLYDQLIKDGLLVAHSECDVSLAVTSSGFKVIQPERLPYISYPYEWSFSQIKDAALLTLKLQIIALKHGMILKDASAYNVQFFEGRPIFIDTLSFEKYQSGPWAAYKQFCQHFFGPLCLLSYTDQRLSKLSLVYVDGAPLDLVSRLLPKKTWFKYSIFAHIHIHARTQNYYANSAESERSSKLNSSVMTIGKARVSAIASQLEAAINNLKLYSSNTEWENYYDNTNYEVESLDHKKNLVSEYITSISPFPLVIQDIGANNGTFSRVAAKLGAYVISQDIDEVAVEKNYLSCKKNNEENILPLILDLTNPSPALGWGNEERSSFVVRSKCNVMMALALIHHVAISNNVPLDKIASLFSGLCEYLIIEFVPKQDSQVKRLLKTREDIFPNYTVDGFELAFKKYFTIVRCDDVKNTERRLYLLKVRDF